MVTAILGVLLATATAVAADAPLRAGREVPFPERTRYFKAEYPDAARRASVMGVVVLRVKVDEKGTPAEIEVLHGMPIIDAAAIAVAKQWRYQPTVVSGRVRQIELMEVVDMFPDRGTTLDYYVAMLTNVKEPLAYRLLACDRLRSLGGRNAFVVGAFRKAAEDRNARVRAAARDALAGLEEKPK